MAEPEQPVEGGSPGEKAAAAAPERILLTSFRLASLVFFVLAAMAMAIHETPAMLKGFTVLTKGFAGMQDVPVAALAILFFVQLGSLGRIVGPPAEGAGPPLRLGTPQAIALLVGMAALIWFLRTQVLFDFDLSRDEQMVTFDAPIFARGHLFWPIPPFWRDWYDALNSNFIMPVGDKDGWVSGYLPMNAALRGVLSQVLPWDGVSPLLVLAGGLALWRITLRLWPASPSTRAVVLILFAGSSQVIVIGTTVYAMTAHMAFNLIWLWLFLQRRPAAHAGAIGLGFLATGLHQPLFHPLFVLPFLAWLLAEKKWRLLLVYVVAYGAIGLFWAKYPGWVSTMAGHPVPADLNVDGISYIDRLTRNATKFTDVSLWMMGANLLRFVAWQHLLLIPLAIVALRARQWTDPVCRALMLGIALLIAIMTVILPPQGHGWGYRYLHGFIGSAVLIAGFGWHWLEQRRIAPVRALRWATGLSVLVLLPAHVWMARHFTAPFAAASARIAAIPADVVIVDTEQVSFSGDLVRNRADLSNRPILLDNALVLSDDLPDLCEGRSLGFADAPLFGTIDTLFGVAPATAPGERQGLLHKAAVEAGCRIVPVPVP